MFDIVLQAIPISPYGKEYSENSIPNQDYRCLLIEPNGNVAVFKGPRKNPHSVCLDFESLYSSKSMRK